MLPIALPAGAFAADQQRKEQPQVLPAIRLNGFKTTAQAIACVLLQRYLNTTEKLNCATELTHGSLETGRGATSSASACFAKYVLFRLTHPCPSEEGNLQHEKNKIKYV
ncbi:hypothetical protein [Pontibacter akesuensis]|nr:hypothetical protein [Pontibacter akesuensis]